MKLHLKRFGWLYAVLLAVIALPLLVFQSQQLLPNPDLATLRRLDKIIRDEYVRRTPGLQRALAPDQAYGEDFLAGLSPRDHDLIINRLAFMAASGAAATPALNSDMERVDGLIGDKMKAHDALTSQGVIFFHVLPDAGPDKQKVPDPSPNFLALQVLSKVRRAQAERAISNRRWDDALRLLESAARFGDPVRYDSLFGDLVDVATRAIGYGGYATLLHADPPPAVERAALDTLVALRRTDPDFDESTIMLRDRDNRLRTFIQAIEAGRLSTDRLFDDLAGGDTQPVLMASVLAKQKDRIREPRLKAWAVRFERDHGDAWGRMTHNQGAFAVPRWTTNPSIRRWLREMIEKEPWTYRDPLIPEAEFPKLDRWTMLEANLYQFTGNLLEAVTRGRVASTRGRLVEAALAARLYRAQNGAWPRAIGDLAALYPLPVEAKTSTSTQTGPYLPLRIAELPLTGELKTVLWSQVLPLSGITWKIGEFIKPDGTILVEQFGATADWMKEPVRLLAIEQALLAHPALVDSAEAEMKTRGTYLPLDPAWARQITDQFDQQRFDPPTRPRATQPAPAAEQPGALRLKAKLKAPEKTTVIWSPGPSGRDDGGLIAYDPTNGTTSRGDLVVFPNNF